MSYKTILVHLNDDRRASQLLAQAVALARSSQAHLVGLHVFPDYHLRPPVSFGIGGSIVGNIKRQVREDADRIKAAFDQQTANQPFSAEWRSITSERTDPAVVVMAHGRAADLVVASQSDSTWDLSDLLDFPERLALEGGRPVLVVPNGAGTAVMPPGRATVAWNGRREAARAAFDALPLLKQATDVQVLTVEEGDGHDHGLPHTALADALSRHGVKATALRVKAAKSIGVEIRERALQHKSDLLVSGAYGHSRLREYAFGGVTRHLLEATPIPVLYSH